MERKRERVSVEKEGGENDRSMRKIERDKEKNIEKKRECGRGKRVNKDSKKSMKENLGKKMDRPVISC